jgi:hypothetical protein
LSLLDRGYRIAAVYGYDWHHPDENPPVYASTYIGADKPLSPDVLTEAVQKGRTYVSMGLRLNLTARNTASSKKNARDGDCAAQTLACTDKRPEIISARSEQSRGEAATEISLGGVLKAGMSEIALTVAPEHGFAARYGIEPLFVRLYGTALPEGSLRAEFNTENICAAAPADGESEIRPSGVYPDKVRTRIITRLNQDGSHAFIFETLLKSGYFIAEVCGNAGGSHGDIAISSPIYVE